MSVINTTPTLEILNQKLSSISNTSVQKQKLVENKVRELIEYIDNIADLDITLNEHLYETRKQNEIIPDTEFPNHVHTINNNSLIIHIKKAQIYKVYNHENLEDFQNDDNTIYRKSSNGPIYEVVRDEYPQKLIIMVNDDIKESQLLEIKTDIIEFIKKNPAFSKTTTSDVNAFSIDGNTEFVLSSVRMDNIYEKEKIIERFILFLKRLGKNVLASKIQIRVAGSLVEGVRMYKMPYAKISLDNNKYDIVDQLITTPSKTPPVIINNNTYIINNGGTINNGTVNTGTVNNINSIENVNLVKASKKTLTTFKNHIKTTKPTWYIENTYVDFTIIEKAYRAYFEDMDIHTSIISRQLNSLIFTKSRRLQNVNKKLLKSFSEL